MPNPNNPLKNFAKLSGLGVQMMTILGVFTFVGLKLDEYYPKESNKYLTLTFSFLGVILSVVHVVRRVTQSSKQ